MSDNKKWLIYWNNGTFERSNLPGTVLVQMIENGIIKIAFHPEEDKAYIRTNEGRAEFVEIPKVGY